MTETADICPDGDLRAPKELIVKLIVAHVTAITAFCNFQSLRNDRLDSIEPVLFLLSPLIVVVQTAFGLAVIHATLLYNVALSPRSFKRIFKDYARHLNILFGRNALPSYVELDDTLSGPSHRRAIRSELGKAWLRLGRAAAIFGTLFQFVATIVLYKRRMDLYGWDSLTVVDHRTFELSVGGAAASILSLALLLRFPGFGEAPTTEYIPRLDMEATVIFCRGDARRCRRWYQILYVSDFGSTTSALTWLFCVGSSTYKGESKWLEMIGNTYVAIFEMFQEWVPTDMSMATFYILLAVFFVVVYVVAQIFTKSSRVKTANTWLVLPSVLVLCIIMLVFFCMLVVVIMPPVLFWFPAMLSGPTCILLTKGYEIRALFSQPPFSASSGESDCFLLWKDPVAEYLWSLV